MEIWPFSNTNSTASVWYIFIFFTKRIGLSDPTTNYQVYSNNGDILFNNG